MIRCKYATIAKNYNTGRDMQINAGDPVTVIRRLPHLVQFEHKGSPSQLNDKEFDKRFKEYRK